MTASSTEDCSWNDYVWDDCFLDGYFLDLMSHINGYFLGVIWSKIFFSVTPTTYFDRVKGLVCLRIDGMFKDCCVIQTKSWAESVWNHSGKSCNVQRRSSSSQRNTDISRLVQHPVVPRSVVPSCWVVFWTVAVS